MFRCCYPLALSDSLLIISSTTKCNTAPFLHLIDKKLPGKASRSQFYFIVSFTDVTTTEQQAPRARAPRKRSKTKEARCKKSEEMKERKKQYASLKLYIFHSLSLSIVFAFVVKQLCVCFVVLCYALPSSPAINDGMKQ